MWSKCAVERGPSEGARSGSTGSGSILDVRVRRTRHLLRRARSASKETNHGHPSPLPPQRPPMSILFQQRIRFSRPPAPRAVEVDGFFSSQQRIIEAPRRFGEICADKEGLVADHHVAEQRLIGFRELAKRLLIVELQRAVAQLERPSWTLHGKTERESFTGLERDQQHIGRNTAGIERPKYLSGRLTKGHRNLGHFTRKAFSRPEIKGHALPSPIVNLDFQRHIRFRGRILWNPRFLTIPANRLIGDLPGRVLPKHNIVRKNRRDGMENFLFFVQNRSGIERHRHFHSPPPS